MHEMVIQLVKQLKRMYCLNSSVLHRKFATQKIENEVT